MEQLLCKHENITQRTFYQFFSIKSADFRAVINKRNSFLTEIAKIFMPLTPGSDYLTSIGGTLHFTSKLVWSGEQVTCEMLSKCQTIPPLNLSLRKSRSLSLNNLPPTANSMSLTSD